MRICKCVSILFLTVFLFSFLLQSCYPLTQYDVYVLLHEPEEEVTREFLKGMIDDLKTEVPIRGICISFYVYDNTTEAINEALNRLHSYLETFKGLEVILQPSYRFESYGVFKDGQWKYPISCFTEQFYRSWYGNLSNLIRNYPNVVLMVGYNEAYLHFENKTDAYTLMQREYTVWKQKSNISFSCETTEPYEYWMSHWNVSNPNFETDVLPVWQNYSDYIGFQLWADRYDPWIGEDPQGNATAFTVMYKAIGYSNYYKKSIHVNELPAWHKGRLKVLADNLCHSPNKICIYKLWDYINSTEKLYALYNVDLTTGKVERVPYTFTVFKDVFGENKAQFFPSLTVDILKAFIPLILLMLCLNIFKKMTE